MLDYIVSSEGQIARLLTPQRTADNYFEVSLPAPIKIRRRLQFGSPRWNRSGFKVLVHHIVAAAFLKPPRRGQDRINHKSGYLNRAANLEWCDQQHNSLDGWNKKRASGAVGFNVSSKEISRISRLHKNGESIRSIARRLGRHTSTVKYWIQKGKV